MIQSCIGLFNEAIDVRYSLATLWLASGYIGSLLAIFDGHLPTHNCRWRTAGFGRGCVKPKTLDVLGGVIDPLPNRRSWRIRDYMRSIFDRVDLSACFYTTWAKSCHRVSTNSGTTQFDVLTSSIKMSMIGLLFLPA
jgi:hypothetical protein